MGRRVSLSLVLDCDFYELEESGQALRRARQLEGAFYTWHTSGLSNWLERGISNIDALGLIALPASLPEQIDMPSDSEVVSENE